MKLSLKVEYACQVLAQLAKSWDKPELPHIEQLAAAEQIPSNYLVQILNDLRTSGLIASRRGKQGGYHLAKPPAEITLQDIVCAIDGDLLGFSAENAGASAARTREVWLAVARCLSDKARSITVEDLMRPADEDMWYI
jgi:Rrf2 family transcriptional regulator, cysteine metabolism repressor